MTVNHCFYGNSIDIITNTDVVSFDLPTTAVDPVLEVIKRHNIETLQLPPMACPDEFKGWQEDPDGEGDPGDIGMLLSDIAYLVKIHTK